MTRPKIGWVDPLALTEDYKKTLRDGAKKVPAAERAKVCAVRKSDLAGTREWIGSALRSIKPWSPDAIEERQCHE